MGLQTHEGVGDRTERPFFGPKSGGWGGVSGCPKSSTCSLKNNIGSRCLLSRLDKFLIGLGYFSLITCPPTSAASAAVVDDSHPGVEWAGPDPFGLL